MSKEKLIAYDVEAILPGKKSYETILSTKSIAKAKKEQERLGRIGYSVRIQKVWSFAMGAWSRASGGAGRDWTQ